MAYTKGNRTWLSRSMLETGIQSNLYSREGKAINNSQETLPAPQSGLARQSLKDPYVFDFLTLHKDHLEKELEQGLIDHIQKRLLELGLGFAFMGRQVHIGIDEKDYYIDLLLFYHAKLHCYVVDLKAKEFDTSDTSQINFYRAAIDNIMRQKEDNPTISLLLCKSKSKLTVEYASYRVTLILSLFPVMRQSLLNHSQKISKKAFLRLKKLKLSLKSKKF